ncbi:alpha/beta hydrolase family protein [Mucilaginibacter ginsenosidivorans]|uniref:Dienelactone hydrolase n=1 Tax=Mucilaginibacter ginsenosidivorans TaxID=398053 RepID=A0A5B8V1I4_9SPHI|nr:dienelactone hydrolase [Mucilaginibacter ginsenosidivorans]QEC64511.1 dienelactone hydrolase [Mucilaginibacter ginsenosidivorans]
MKRSIFIIISFLLPVFALAQNIGERTIRFNDTTRKRPLVTEIWYPTADAVKPGMDFKPFLNEATVKDGAIGNGKHPLILISHGTGGGRLTLEWLADNLVHHGFMVAAVDHWGNTYDNKIAIDFVTPWERARDISFVLSGLLNDRAFGPHIDQDKIGAAGFSIGGYTVIALAGGRLDFDAIKAYTNTPGGQQEINIPEFPGLKDIFKTGEVDESFKKSPKSLKDKRIKAFFAICPAIGQGFVKPSQFRDVNNPLYVVGAESDSIAPYKTNAEHYHKLMPASKYLLVKGKAGHYVFLGEAAEPVKKQAPLYFMDDPSVDRHAIHQQVGDLASEFFMNELK